MNEWITVEEAATLVRKTSNAIYYHVKQAVRFQNRFSVKKVGTNWKIHRESFLNYIDSIEGGEEIKSE